MFKNLLLIVLLVLFLNGVHSQDEESISEDLSQVGGFTTLDAAGLEGFQESDEFQEIMKKIKE